MHLKPQAIELKKRLKIGWTTPLIALNDLGIFRMSARINEIKKTLLPQEVIQTKWITTDKNARIKAFRILEVRGVS